MASFLDVCRFNPTAGGTTDWTYSTAVLGYQSPALAGAVNGATYRYRAESNDLTQWEIGFGTYNSGTGVFSRTTVLFNSSGTGTGAGQSGAGTKINFSTVPQVAIVFLAEDITGTMASYEYTATAGQTVFSGADVNSLTLAYTPSLIIVFVNGERVNKADYTAVNGTSVTLNSGAPVGALVTIVAFATGTLITALLVANNLSDVASPSAALNNINGVSYGASQSLTSGQKDQASVNIGTVRAVRIQVFTTSGTYTPDPNLLYADMIAVGGGGAGGSATGSVSTSVGGGGGGSGSPAQKIATAATIGASQSITIGAGGTGGSGNGGNGGDTSVGTLCIGKGGIGGLNMNGTTGGTGGLGGVAGTGDFTPTGNSGTNGQSISSATSLAVGGTGAGSIWGGAGRGARDAGVGTAGNAATNYGAGGGAGACVGVAATGNGGSGSAGAVVITEYCSK